MKTHLSSVVALALSLSGILSAQESTRLKVATVDMQALFKDFHQTKTTKLKFEEEQQGVAKDFEERQKALVTLKEEADSMQKQLGDPSIADAKKQQLFSERQAKLQQFEATQNELQEFVQRKKRALAEEMQLRTKAILEEIQGKVEAFAAKDNYDYVLDKTGTSTSQVPILLYTKDATDITGALLAIINEGAPAAPEEQEGE